MDFRGILSNRIYYSLIKALKVIDIMHDDIGKMCYEHYGLLISYFPKNSPLPLPHPPHSHSQSSPTLSVPMSPLFVLFCLVLPLLSPIIPLPLPSGHSQYVFYFQVSGSILIIFLFCWLGPTYRWDHMVFIFHRLAISLSRRLSSSIHAVMKGRSSFFLSVV